MCSPTTNSALPPNNEPSQHLQRLKNKTKEHLQLARCIMSPSKSVVRWRLFKGTGGEPIADHIDVHDTAAGTQTKSLGSTVSPPVWSHETTMMGTRNQNHQQRSKDTHHFHTTHFLMPICFHIHQQRKFHMLLPRVKRSDNIGMEESVYCFYCPQQHCFRYQSPLGQQLGRMYV